MKVIVKPELIRELRIRKGWTQEALAELSGVHTRTIQRIENTGAASVQSLAALALSLDVSAEFLLIDAVDDLSEDVRSALRKPAPFSIRYKSRFGQLLRRHDSTESWAHGAWVGWAVVLMGAMLVVSVIFLSNGLLSNGELDRSVIFSVFLPGTTIGTALMLIGRYFAYLSEKAQERLRAVNQTTDPS